MNRGRDVIRSGEEGVAGEGAWGQSVMACSWLEPLSTHIYHV